MIKFTRFINLQIEIKVTKFNSLDNLYGIYLYFDFAHFFIWRVTDLPSDAISVPLKRLTGQS